MNCPLPEFIPFPLYHGTSTIWRQSIEASGLGGRDIVQEVRAIECLKYGLASLKRLSESNKLFWEIKQLELLSTQSTTRAGFNFRHGGGPYLTPSRFTALQYAKNNRFGSEIISECVRIYEEHGISDMDEKFPELFSLSKSGAPLLVTVTKVFTADLCAESGDPQLENLSFLLEEIWKSREESKRIQNLRSRARAGDIEALTELATNGTKHFLSEEKLKETIGQQINFQAKVIYPRSQLVFEVLPPSTD
jgi:hypothetical protein